MSQLPILSLDDMKDCLKDYGINSEVYKDKNHSLTTQELYCPGACQYRNSGAMLDNGTIDVEQFMKVMKDDPYIVIFDDLHKQCRNETHCELIECFINEAEKSQNGVTEPNNEVTIGIRRCLKDYDIDADIYKDRSRNFTDQEISCELACYYREMGLIREDQTLDRKQLKKFLVTDEKIKLFDLYYGNCKEKTHCALISCMIKEMEKTSPQDSENKMKKQKKQNE